nr:hypothetical protein [Sinorhizobium fredii]
MALWDALGKKLEEPVYRLLGYERAFPKQPYVVQPFASAPEQTSRYAERCSGRLWRREDRLERVWRRRLYGRSGPACGRARGFAAGGPAVPLSPRRGINGEASPVHAASYGLRHSPSKPSRSRAQTGRSAADRANRTRSAP